MVFKPEPRGLKHAGIKRPYYPLPEPLTPSGLGCVSMMIPDSPDYRSLFLSAMTQLGYWFSYERDESHGGRVVANNWRVAVDSLTWDCCNDCDEEDTLEDAWQTFLDGLQTQFQTGGIVSAVGYVVDLVGDIVINTGLKVIAVTVIGVAVAGVVQIILGGTVLYSVGVGAGEVAEIIFPNPGLFTDFTVRLVA